MVFRDKSKDGSTRLTGAGPLAAYPVGAVYMSVNNTSPATLFGGTWSRLKGKFLVGVDEADTDFDTSEESAGSKTISAANLPPHAHTINHSHPAVNTTTNGAHDHEMHMNATAGTTTNSIKEGAGGPVNSRDPINSDGDHAHTVTIPAYAGSSGNGPGTSATFLPPYLAVYMWKRTA